MPSILCSAFRISRPRQGKCMFVFTWAWIHKKCKMALLKSCIFPLTLFMRNSTHEHRRLGKKAVGMKTTLNKYIGNITHITETTQNSADIYLLFCSLHSRQRFSPSFQPAGIKKYKHVWGRSGQFCADFPTSFVVFFHAGPCGVFLESQLEGSQWSMHAEALPVPAGSSHGLPRPVHPHSHKSRTSWGQAEMVKQLLSDTMENQVQSMAHF